MATLTESMTRLQAEIVCQRIRRQSFWQELVRGTKARRDYVAAVRGALARDLAGGRAAWSAPHRAAPQPPIVKAPFLAAPSPMSKANSKNRKKRR